MTTFGRRRENFKSVELAGPHCQPGASRFSAQCARPKCHQRNDSLQFPVVRRVAPKRKPRRRIRSTGLFPPLDANLHALGARPRSAHLYIGEFARDARRHIRPADTHARCQPLALVPPLTSMHATKEPQMFSIGKNTHVDPRTLQNKHWRERQSKCPGPRECRSNLARSPSIVP
jgi:hypothetical protein